jgi:transposase
MQVRYRRCAGLDVPKETVVACVRLAPGGKVVTPARTFATTTAGPLALSDRLARNGCTHVAMAATGVYWRPAWPVLGDGAFTLVLANAAPVRNVPGRRSDVRDAAWLAELLAHGLLRARFVPAAATQELGTLSRTRKQLGREQASHPQRIHKTLEDANIKLDAVIAEVLGKRGRAMLEALIVGESDPARLVALAHPGLKGAKDKRHAALHGRVQPHRRFLLRLHLDQTDALDRHRPGGRRQARPLSHRGRAPELDPWRRHAGRRGHRRRDRHRPEPLPQRRPPPVLGRLGPEERRERGQAPRHPS